MNARNLKRWRGDGPKDAGGSEWLFRPLADLAALEGGNRSIGEGGLADKKEEGKDQEPRLGLEHSQLRIENNSVEVFYKVA